MAKKFYGVGIPEFDVSALTGKLIVVEGCDGAGRSTQVSLIKNSLEHSGFPVTEVQMKQSELVGKELIEIMKGNVLTPQTMSLLYMTDFADLLENSILPALKAGFVVVSDRYIYTIIARHVVRGIDQTWLKNICSVALVPDLVIYLNAKPQTLAERIFHKYGTLNYWESGMDISTKNDVFENFISYQKLLHKQFLQMSKEYKFISLSSEAEPMEVFSYIEPLVLKLMK